VIESLAKSLTRTFLLVTICCGVTACVTTQNYEETLNLLKGSSEVSLIKSWGQPTDTFNSNGHKFLVYQDSKTTAFEPMKNYSSGSHDYLKALSCTTVFELLDGHVVEWAIKGNNCRR
jgi:hypothetical protein